jgi:hypothetical protein
MSQEELTELRERARQLNKNIRELEALHGGSYDRHREDAAARSRAKSSTGREIGPLPPVRDPERKEHCRLNLKAFNETYLTARFNLAWSPDHITAIGLLQQTTLSGGQYAFAMMRGGGKTALSEGDALWSVLYGHRRFPVPIGATQVLADAIIDSLKIEIETNELLLADFPEVCFPIRCLDGIANRCKGQTYQGQRTRMVWTDSEIVLPTIADSAASGARIRAAGLTSALRGMKATTADGRVIRPDKVILDDPQTDESAKSPTQNAARKAIIGGAVLGLAGPGKKISAVMPCTVIYPGDLADEFLNRELHPEWHGQRFKMLYTPPSNWELWDKYAAIRRESLRAGNRGAEGTEFYRENREAMDAGAVVAWPECYKPDELSALQSAMNIKIDNPKGFAAECQNEPQIETIDLRDVRQIEEEDLVRKLNNLERGTVPRECNRLTAFFDVQAEVIFWAVCGWTEKFGGALVDYGTFPRQPRPVFSGSSPDVKLSDKYKDLKRPARVYAALAEIVPQVLGRGFAQADATGMMTVSLGLIDAGFETEAVHDFLSRSPLKPLLHASMGKGIQSHKKPMNEYRKEPGDLVGWNWRLDAKTLAKGRYVAFDTYPWKTFIAEAILTPAGAPGAFYLCGKSLMDHQLLTTHLLCEYRSPSLRLDGQRVEVWSERPDRRENHWWDCVVGCAVGASMLGVTFSAAVAAGEQEQARQKPVKINVREEQEKKRREFEARRRYGQ